MGILSKLFGDKNEKSALDRLKGIVQEAVEGITGEEKPAPAPQTQPLQVGGGSVTPIPAATGPSGFSWGEVMPDEENQFNLAALTWNISKKYSAKTSRITGLKKNCAAE